MQALTDTGAIQKTLQVPQPEGVPASHLPEGHAAYVPEKGALVFVATNLLPLPPDKTYELWVLPPTGSGKQPIPAGIFKPDSKGDASVVMPDIPKGEEASGFAVTIEADGGTKQPTMPIVLVGM
jgi:anti-sigma-K factor RskA